MPPSRADRAWWICARRFVAFAVAAATVAHATPIAAQPRPSSAPVVVVRRGPIHAGLAGRIEAIVSSRRSVVPLKSLPAPSRSPEELANEQRVEAIALALRRARKHEEVADWEACAKTCANALGPATEVLATANKLGLLRDLHQQIGACMSLAGQEADALPHFRTATLLDETPPKPGMHREEAELAHLAARKEVLARALGNVRIVTDPPGAEVWVDGTRAKGVTPLSVPVRLGQHFVTLRRFRHESQTTQQLLQPKSTLRLSLASARRDTLREQLGQVRAGTLKVPDSELDLARAMWAGAQRMVLLSKPPGPSVAIRIRLHDTSTGRLVRSRMIPIAAADDEVRREVCSLLGEKCPDNEGVNPHLIWPFAVAAAVGTAIAIGFILDSQRSTVFCPMDGC